MKKTIMAIALAAATQAHASLINLEGSDDTIALSDVVDHLVLDTPSAAGDVTITSELYVGRDVYLPQRSKVTFTAITSESAWTNVFVSIGQSLYDEINDGASISGIYEAGLLDFGFFVEDTGQSVINGNNAAQYESDTFLPHFGLVGIATTAGDGYLIGLQDDGNTVDYDFDDHIIAMQIEAAPLEVPEPMPAALLGLGLIGVGLTRLKRRGPKQ